MPTVRYSDLKGKFKDAIDAVLARNRTSKPKRTKKNSLERRSLHTDCMVNIPGKVLIRITRNGLREYDSHDNLRAGCKSLVDAIAAAIGKQGDSEKDGVTVEYVQKPGSPPATLIQILDNEVVE